ncbi:MAG: EthD domain-containing protein [Pedobacter sp.]
MIKFIILLKRRSGTTHDEFVSYHKNIHAPLFASLKEVKENVRSYVQCHSLQINIPGLPPDKYDGVTELWFDDLDSIGKVFHSERYLQLIRPDEERFLDLQGCDFLISQENLVI